MMRASLLAVVALSTSGLAASPVLSGLYSVGELGTVEFSMIDGKVVGKLRASHQCVFPPDTNVVNGVFEGGVFVGNVTLCQDGATCQGQKTYSVLGVFHVDTVAAFIHLDPGCTSPALDGKSLFMRPASLEEKQRILSGNSATNTAQKGNKDPSQAALEAVKRGTGYLNDNKFPQAREEFRQALDLEPSNFIAIFGFGSAELNLGNNAIALDYMDKALQAAPLDRNASPGIVAQVHFNRACAFALASNPKQAVAALRTAVKLGGAVAFVDSLKNEPMLSKIREDVEFKKFAAETNIAAKKKTR